MKTKLLILPLLVVLGNFTAQAAMRDSNGGLRPGVYRVATGSPYLSHLTLEISNGNMFQMHLVPRAGMPVLDRNFLLSGRIVEDRNAARDFGLQHFNLRINHVWRIENDIIIAKSPMLIQPIEISMTLGQESRAYGFLTYDTTLLGVRAGPNGPGEFFIFLRKLLLPHHLRSAAADPYARFDRSRGPVAETCRTFFKPLN